MGVYHSAYFGWKPVRKQPSEYLRGCIQLTLGDAVIKLNVFTEQGEL